MMGGVTLHDLDIAYAAQHAAEAQLAAYAEAPGVAARRGRDWFAVRTAVDSNDMNGVVSTSRAEIPAELVEDLVGWFRAGAVSASWLTTRPDPQLTRTLLAAGARADRTGYWSGCSMPTPARQPDAGVEVVRVASHDHLEKCWTWPPIAGGSKTTATATLGVGSIWRSGWMTGLSLTGWRSNAGSQSGLPRRFSMRT